MFKSATHLLDNLEDLDSVSLLHLLKVFAYNYNNQATKFRLTHKQLGEIEAKLISGFREYVKKDITIPIVCLIRLNYFPKTLINELN